MRSKPEANDLVFVELTPHVEHAEDHGIHEEGDVHGQGDDHAADPVEEEHEGVVGGTALEHPSLQPDGVVVQEVEVDQKVESRLRGEGVEEERRHRAPQVKRVDEVFPD